MIRSLLLALALLVALPGCGPAAEAPDADVQQAVLAEVEGQVKEDAILASNTSTISISLLAKALKRPENFVGMHFFNPVHMMPLVEVIRGEKSGEVAVATTVAYARKIGAPR